MKPWGVGVLALIAAVFAVALTRSRPARHAADPVAPTPPAIPAREPAAAGPAVVDVVDLAAELDRPAADDRPFVPFDGPAFPGPGPGPKGVPAGAF